MSISYSDLLAEARNLSVPRTLDAAVESLLHDFARVAQFARSSEAGFVDAHSDLIGLASVSVTSIRGFIHSRHNSKKSWGGRAFAFAKTTAGGFVKRYLTATVVRAHAQNALDILDAPFSLPGAGDFTSSQLEFRAYQYFKGEFDRLSEQRDFAATLDDVLQQPSFAAAYKDLLRFLISKDKDSELEFFSSTVGAAAFRHVADGYRSGFFQDQALALTAAFDEDRKERENANTHV